jgi:hypothetical protein
MTIHVEEVAITEDGRVVVSGQVSASNISVQMVARAYVQAPEDGIWEYDLSESLRGSAGAMVMLPFSVTAALPSYREAAGVRIHVPRPDGTIAAITKHK